MASTTDIKASAVAFKDKGNAAFKAQNWLEAIDCYTQAIDLKNDEPPFYTNRAQVGLPLRHKTCPLLTLRDRLISNSKTTAWQSQMRPKPLSLIRIS